MHAPATTFMTSRLNTRCKLQDGVGALTRMRGRAHVVEVDACFVAEELFGGAFGVCVATATTTQHFDVLTRTITVAKRVHFRVQTFVIHHVVAVSVQHLVQA